MSLFAGRSFRLGDYFFSIVERELAVAGPSHTLCRAAEDEFVRLAETEAGAALLGDAIAEPGVSGARKSELARRLHLPDPAQPVVEAGAADFDEDRDALRAYRLPALCRRWIDELQGMCAMIVADGSVDDREIQVLNTWLETSIEASSMWPVSEMRDILCEIQRDGVVTEQERTRLLRLLQAISADPERRHVPADTIFDADPVIDFAGRLIMFTGQMTVKRSYAVGLVTAGGGKTTDSPSRRVNVLVVGDLGSGLWLHSRYGRKIQAIMEHKRDGAAITVANEAAFHAAVRRHGLGR